MMYTSFALVYSASELSMLDSSQQLITPCKPDHFPGLLDPLASCIALLGTRMYSCHFCGFQAEARKNRSIFVHIRVPGAQGLAFPPVSISLVEGRCKAPQEGFRGTLDSPLSGPELCLS